MHTDRVETLTAESPVSPTGHGDDRQLAHSRTRISRVRGLTRSIFRRQPIATLVVMTFLAVGVLAPILAPYDPNEIHMPDRLEGPSREYWLGTDEFGRDLMSRIIFGARIAFQAGVVAVSIAMVGGVLIGLIAGYARGFWETLTLVTSGHRLRTWMETVFVLPWCVASTT